MLHSNYFRSASKETETVVEKKDGKLQPVLKDKTGTATKQMASIYMIHTLL